MLSIKNLSFAYPRKSSDVVHDFSLEVDGNGIYGLLGPNGAGKSTLIYLIAGLLTPKHGMVCFDGADTRRRLPSTLSDMFVVPEEISLPAISIKKYIDIYAPFYPKFSLEDMQEYIKTFDLSIDYNLGSLSMGQRKKAYMCFAMASNASLMLMDEPTNGMDIDSKACFRQFIGGNADDGKTIIISTHQVRDIDSILDHVILMRKDRSPLCLNLLDVSDCLAFISTNDPEIVSRALFTVPDYNGMSVILPNDGSLDTNVNIELLYQFANQRPEMAAKFLES